MPTGMEFLLQSLGLDPDQIRGTMTAVQNQFEQVNIRLGRMESKLDKALGIEQVTMAVTNGNSERPTGPGTGAGTRTGTSGGE